VHRHTAYAHVPPVDLPVTDQTASRALSLPMFAELTPEDIDRVVGAVASLAHHPLTSEVPR
jgi:dTDP-4-amino-4,6-dideoxygalactose transaminase